MVFRGGRHYNTSGCITKRTHTSSGESEHFCWNEDQSLAGVAMDASGTAAHYVYDHQGERVLKTLLHGFTLNSQSEGQSHMSMDPSTVYVNPYFIVSHYKETALASKHYYMGSQRLASAMINYWPYGDEVPTGEPGGGQSPGEPGEGGDDGGGPVGDFPAHYSNPGTDGALLNLQSTMNCLGSTELVQLDWANLLPLYSLQDYPVDIIACDGSEQVLEGGTALADPECPCEQSLYWAQQQNFHCDELNILYFYHPDYLGSIEFITDMRGDPYQFFLNTPWGENLEN